MACPSKTYVMICVGVQNPVETYNKVSYYVAIIVSRSVWFGNGFVSGGNHDKADRYISLTILTDVKADDPVMQVTML
jgi:hypothetical protein